MPSIFIREIKVVRLIPFRPAAPFAPPARQCSALKVVKVKHAHRRDVRRHHQLPQTRRNAASRRQGEQDRRRTQWQIAIYLALSGKQILISHAWYFSLDWFSRAVYFGWNLVISNRQTPREFSLLGEPGELVAFRPHHLISEAGSKYLFQLQTLCHAESPAGIFSSHDLWSGKNIGILVKRRISDVKSKGGIDTLWSC
jgi:hypothetical protein